MSYQSDVSRMGFLDGQKFLFAILVSETTVLLEAVWEGREEDDFEPGDLLDRDKRRFDGRNPRWEGDDMKAFIS